MDEKESTKSHFTGLILLSGVDAPGVTEALFETLTPFSLTVIDLEQVVIRGRLILTCLLQMDPAHAKAIEEELTALATQLGLDFAIDFTQVALPSASAIDSEFSTKKVHLHIVILGEILRPRVINLVAGVIASTGGNIDRIRRTASYPLTAIEFDISLLISGSSMDSVHQLRKDLAAIAQGGEADIAVELGGLTRRAKRIVLLDMDSTLIQQEVIDLLAERVGVGQKVSEITARAMAGELDFQSSLRERVALLAGLPETTLKEVAMEIVLTPGARTLIRTLHRLGHKVGVVSGGFMNVIEPILKELDVDFYSANTLEVVAGKLTGKLTGTVIDGAGKAQALRDFSVREGVTLEQTIAIGDGANDLAMIELAGLGIAFNAKPAVRAAADSAITTPYLDSVLYLMGITREEIELADTP
jgi:phosphoserine phosphatase